MGSRAARRPTARSGPSPRPGVRTLALLLVGLALLAVAHAALIAGAALLTRFVVTGALAQLAAALPFDPIYTRVLLQFLVQAEVRGLAVAGPPGQFLHDLLPTLFAPPGRMAPLALAVPVFSPGTSVVVKTVARILADVALLTLGLLLVRSGKRWTARRILGGLLLAEATLAALRNPLSLAEMEAAGLSFAIGVLVTALTGRWLALSDLLEPLPAAGEHLALALLTLGPAALLTALILGPVFLLLAIARGPGARIGRG